MPMPTLFEKGWAYYLDALTALSQQPLNVSYRYWDRVFYDVGSVRDIESTLFPRGIQSPFPYREGEILVVSPRGAEKKLRYYQQTQQFLDKESQDIRAIVVAGVGSSAYGTVALARNVADTYNFDVAGIVTGYGGSDLLTEAMGGWFVFGALDRAGLRFDNERIAKTPDVATLVDILLNNPSQLELLVGHSKGSLLIDFVLQWFLDELQDIPDSRYENLFNRLNIVTLGAVVSLPERFTNVRQFMGELDDFGEANSHQGVRYKKVPGAWHHLNPQLPPYIWHQLNRQWRLGLYNHLDVSKVLRSKPDDFPETTVRSNFALMRS
jgi:hypothetical protein